jgi:hypothetical protein
MRKSKTWYVDFPTYQYNENVKEIAREKGLKIVDSKFKGSNKQCANAPKLTKKGDKEEKKDK